MWLTEWTGSLRREWCLSLGESTAPASGTLPGHGLGFSFPCPLRRALCSEQPAQLSVAALLLGFFLILCHPNDFRAIVLLVC